LTWSPPLGASPDRYILASLDGKAIQFLPATSTSASAPVNGMTCFLVAALRNGGLLGYADSVCGLPGIARNL
jgi:hypothetical protein